MLAWLKKLFGKPEPTRLKLYVDSPEDGKQKLMNLVAFTGKAVTAEAEWNDDGTGVLTVEILD